MPPRTPCQMISTAALVFMLLPIAAVWGAEDTSDERALSTANARALPDTYLVALTFADGAETLEFSTVTAMRHFSLAPPDRRIRFRGRLWLQPDGRELLDFTLELGHLISQVGSDDPVSRDGKWAGSAYVESGRAIKLVENPSSTVTVRLKKQ